MSLDVYVMPLWRFKSGHAQTAVGRVFPGMSAIIDAFGIFSPTRRRARRHSRDLVNKLVTEAEGVLNTKLIWQDRGSVVFAEQASWGFQALQAYAKWLDLTDVFPTFSDPPENNFYKHPTMLWSEGTHPLRFSHITYHCLFAGYFFPCRFDRVVQIEPYDSWGGHAFHQSLGSSYTLADHLELLDASLPSKSDVSETTHDLIHAGFDFLKVASAKSIEHQLPIIFWG